MPRIAIVVFNKIAPTTTVIIVTRKLFPIISILRLKITKNEHTIPLAINTTNTPPIFSKIGFSFLNNGTRLPINAPIHAVG